MDKKNEFKPYIPAEKITPEMTITSVVMGIILAVVFGAANAYLGLQVGMTVSASIPAAVIAMGVIRMVMRKNSVLESNMVQTIGSAGESVAAGAIFTLPALFMWAAEGKNVTIDLVSITLIALIGGTLGVLFMIPLRNALIVKEHGVLPYPEGAACAEVLLAGEKGGASASTVFAGMGFAALFKFIADGLKVAAGEMTFKIKGFAGAIGTQAYPAVLSVGYICGARISSFMFAGGVLSWLGLIPLIVLFGGDNILLFGSNVNLPAEEQLSIAQIFAADGASGIWSKYVRYIGAGALAAGGIISLIKSLPLIISTFGGAMKSMTGAGKAGTSRTEQDLNLKIVIAAIVVLTLAIWLIPAIPVDPLGALVIVLFGFFFATVSSRMVGLVGSSNNPVSGMTIATLLITTLILKMTGATGTAAMTSAIAIGSIICIVCAIAGDTSQDLKTGYLLGATPKKQQMGELLGVLASALAVGGTMFLLNSAWGFGEGSSLQAPQASIMKLIVEGVMGGNLPWALVLTGAFIAVAVEVLRIPVLPFAIGMYLPIHTSACIMIGGLIRLALDNLKRNKEEKETIVNDGVLFCSGMIAGEGLVGILLAVLAVLGVNVALDEFIPEGIRGMVTTIGGLVLLAVIVLTLLKFSLWRKRTPKTNEE